ncbi:hypothetical protein ET495_07490 [Xylanimonas allomyrinae]|uniref:ABC transporter-associated repeat protein n=1 Tax=Xylanimonas allomyrinae TaxID=2509459 RepID=A0A4P6EN37_9MICO|nr:hypothetical protein ET495_07490 [Xylanimonas allomyrinae]
MPLAAPRPAAAALAAALLALTAPASPAGAATAPPDDDPALDQTLATDQPVAHGEHVLSQGHVDLGPRFDGGRWSLLVHDDAAKAGGTSVWRHPDDVVLQVADAAAAQVPDDPAYGFLGAAPGAQVWVLPQTQDPDVVWLGWNTQDPEVMARIDRGVTLSLAGVQGPGDVTVYLQSGSFGEPDVLADSRSAEPGRIWVDVNTHTHASWVFTQPGVYLVALRAEATLIDGTDVSDTRVLRFAVGSATSVAQARSAAWRGEVPGGADPAARAADGDDGASLPVLATRDGIAPVLLTVGALAGLVLAGAVVLGARGRRARARALTARGTAAGPGDPAPGDDSAPAGDPADGPAPAGDPADAAADRAPGDERAARGSAGHGRADRSPGAPGDAR